MDSQLKREDLILNNDARVASIDLDAGEISPWHHHSEVIENTICLKGKITLLHGASKKSTELLPGERATINSMIGHNLVNNENIPATYLLIQSGTYDFVASNS